jgi:pantothenate kinase
MHPARAMTPPASGVLTPITAAEWVYEHCGHRPGRTLIALAGLPGSGKSTVARQIERAFNARAGREMMLAVGMDGFHLSKAVLLSRPDGVQALARRGAPWTFDADGMAQRLRAIRADDGRAVSWPEFAHEVGDPVDEARLISPEARVILVEGLYVLLDEGPWRAVRAAFDLRWFLDVPPAVARERLILRHMSAWKLLRAEAEERASRNDDLNAALVLPTREGADAWLWEAT